MIRELENQILSYTNKNKMHTSLFGLHDICIKAKADKFDNIDWANGYLSSFLLRDTSSVNVQYQIIHISSVELIREIKHKIDRYSVSPVTIPFYQNRVAFKFSSDHSRYVIVPINPKADERVNNAFFPDEEYYLVVNKTIYILSSQLEKKYATEFTRIIRDVITKLSNNQGFFHLHGSAVEINNKGYLFCGGKGVGKTTLLLKLLDSIECSFVANDRILIGNDSGRICIHNWPTAVYLLLDTLKDYKNIYDDLVNNKLIPEYPQFRFWNKTHLERRYEKYKVGFLQDELARLFEKKITRKTNPRCVFLIKRTGSPVSIRELDCNDEELIESFHQNVFPIDEDQYPDVFKLYSMTSDEFFGEIDKNVGKLNKTVRILSVSGHNTTNAIYDYIINESNTP